MLAERLDKVAAPLEEAGARRRALVGGLAVVLGSPRAVKQSRR
jgi:hypothetical protein